MLHKLISTTTASEGTGRPTQKKLFRVRSGPFTGRLLALFSRTPSVLSTSYADPPYTKWNDPVDVVTESADLPFGAVMDENAHVYLAYTQQTTDALRCVKLVFANGIWATQTPVTVYDSGASSNKYPSILKDDYDRIWIAWTRDDAGTYTMRSKSSIDDGQTFGAGASDAGSDLSGNTTSCFGRLIARANYIHCVFTMGTTTVKNRDRDLDAALWNTVDTLYTGTGLGSDFGAAVSVEGMLGCLFAADSKLYLKEYDGAVWGALQTASAQAVTSPTLRYLETAPHAMFLQSIGTDQAQLMETHRVAGSFTTPQGVLSQLAPFATVLCFDADAPTAYADITVEAADSSGADAMHPTSGALVEAAGDAVYLGGDDRFSFTRILLSTPGVGGTIIWSYWDGAAWASFVPDSGAYHLDASNAGVRLFPDTAGSPVAWQKAVVNSTNRYWIRAEVATAYTTAPVGSQLTAVSKTANAILRV